MKFKSKRTGTIVYYIQDALPLFCSEHGRSGPFERSCLVCPMDKNKTGVECWRLVRTNPVEAARLMGYEVIKEEHK